MQRSATFTVLITKHAKGFEASCPALADCATQGRSRAAAYKAIKALIRHRLARLVELDRPAPTDPIVSTKLLRINLMELRREVDLR